MGVSVDAIVCFGVDLGLLDADEREDAEERREALADEIWGDEYPHLEVVHYCNLYDSYTTGMIVAVASTVQTVTWQCEPLDTSQIPDRVRSNPLGEYIHELQSLGIEGECRWLLAAAHG